jgi:hypothetical protein
VIPEFIDHRMALPVVKEGKGVRFIFAVKVSGLFLGKSVSFVLE